MPQLRRRRPIKTANEAIETLANARQFIETSTRAHNAISDRNRGMIADDIKVVSDNLPAMLSLFRDIQGQWSTADLGGAVWLAAEDSILDCYYACNGLEMVLRDAYKRLDLDEGAPVTEDLDKLLGRKGQKARMFLGIFHGSMTRLELSKIVTDVGLLDGIGYALAQLRSSAKASRLIQNSIKLIQSSLEAYSAVREEHLPPRALEDVSAQLFHLLDIFKDARCRWQERMLDDQAWMNAEADIARCHAECEELVDYLRCAYPRLRLADLDQDDEDNHQSILDRDVDMAEHHLVELCACLRPLLRRGIFTKEILLNEVEALADSLLRMWKAAEDDMQV